MDFSELWLYSNFPVYKSDFKKIEEQIKKSDVLITDGTHRIVGLMFDEKIASSPIITIQCIRSEIAFAKQIAFANNIKIVQHRLLSALLFQEYTTGSCIREREYGVIAEIYADLYRARRKI